MKTELNTIKGELGVNDDELEQYLKDERRFLQELTEPSTETTLKIQYIRALRDLSQCKYVSPYHWFCCYPLIKLNRHEWEVARGAANHALTVPAPADIQNALLLARNRIDSAYTKLQNAETLVCSIEGNLSIQERWTASSPEYIKFHEETVITNYQAALDELERLVVMRLFELAKLSVSGTGMY
jgi:hypothetical protein